MEAKAARLAHAAAMVADVRADAVASLRNVLARMRRFMGEDHEETRKYAAVLRGMERSELPAFS